MSTPVENEARAVETIDVEWNGNTYTIAASADDWPVEVTLAFEENKAATAVKMLLGAEQWDTFAAMRPTNRDMAELFDTIAKRLGFTSAGE